ncbi:hypothetical protein [Polaribacter aquimarinus]|uniref:Uncharacterized protein n=1 Tax=Polaribacter aquimarinus TaxID=2100726 RepID=A0A2U2JEY0_9FLAO|nr:hypothetical protein [Polaribacter aquimarinus]PWG06862.1 hypothetical protein DIS07_03215 [Polaribacter aquimarinus]
MKEVLKTVFFIGWFLMIVINSFIFFQNIWIYYSQNKKKFKWFPFLSPFSFNSYELMISSLLTYNWKIENKNIRNKRKVNKLSKILGYLFLMIIFTGIIFLLL